MKKKILAVMIGLFFAANLAYFVLWPAIGWKPCGDLDEDKLEYVYFFYRNERYDLSETEIAQFVEFARQIRVYPMPGDISGDDRKFTFYYKCVGESEENLIQLESTFVKYNDTWYHVGEKYWNMFYGEGLNEWCSSLAIKVQSD